MSSDEFVIAADVRFSHYLGVACPSCGRHRLELRVDGPDEAKRAVGIRCEKCFCSWLLDPTKAEYWADLAEHDPLRDGSMPLSENNPFEGSGGTER